jgi:hypothetical protein
MLSKKKILELNEWPDYIFKGQSSIKEKVPLEQLFIAISGYLVSFFSIKKCGDK